MKRYLGIIAVLLIMAMLFCFSFANDQGGQSIIGTEPFSSAEEFAKHFDLPAGFTFSNNILTMGSGNIFSKNSLDAEKYTISLKGKVGAYNPGDVVEICVNIGVEANHYRFMIKDTGSERQNVPRNAYARIAKLVNGQVDNANSTTEKSLGKVLDKDNWFDIKIEVDGNKADFYVDDVLVETVVSNNAIAGSLGLRGKNVSFKELKVTEVKEDVTEEPVTEEPDTEELYELIGANPFESEEEFLKHFDKPADIVFANSILTLGTSNIFSKNIIDVDKYTIMVKVCVGEYKAGDIVEICINIGDVSTHHRFMIKDIGSERNNVPRDAYTKYRRIVNGQPDDSVATEDRNLGSQLVKNSYFDVKIIVDGTKAYMYVDDVLCHVVENENGFKGKIGFRGKGSSFKELSIVEGAEIPNPETGEADWLVYAVSMVALSIVVFYRKPRAAEV